MSFNWKEFIDLSEELKQRQEEKYLRTSISRAYYGIFCICRNKKGLKNFTKTNVHFATIKQYKTSGDKNEKWIGKALDDLRKERNDADYNEDKEISVELAEKTITKAKDILQKLGI